jgi:hypothetical protein
MSYFRTETGRKVYYHDIAQAIDTLYPQQRNKDIFKQLEALGLYGEFRRGETPCGLPYSFSEYLEETPCCTLSQHEKKMQNMTAMTFGSY